MVPRLLLVPECLSLCFHHCSLLRIKSMTPGDCAHITYQGAWLVAPPSKPCIKAASLKTPRNHAGLGVPDLRSYYKPKSCGTSSLQPWTLIEAVALPQTPLLLLAAIWKGYHPPHYFLPTVNATVSIWKSVLQALNGLHTQKRHQFPLSALSLLSMDPSRTGPHEVSKRLVIFFNKTSFCWLPPN